MSGRDQKRHPGWIADSIRVAVLACQWNGMNQPPTCVAGTVGERTVIPFAVPCTPGGTRTLPIAGAKPAGIKPEQTDTTFQFHVAGITAELIEARLHQLLDTAVTSFKSLQPPERRVGIT
jgi:hypothetical protein